jgi:hypothetical protein
MLKQQTFPKLIIGHINIIKTHNADLNLFCICKVRIKTKTPIVNKNKCTLNTAPTELNIFHHIDINGGCQSLYE